MRFDKEGVTRTNQKVVDWLKEYLKHRNVNEEVIRNVMINGNSLPWIVFKFREGNEISFRFESNPESLLLYEISVIIGKDETHYNWEDSWGNGGVEVYSISNTLMPTDEERWYLDSCAIGFSECLSVLDNQEIDHIFIH